MTHHQSKALIDDIDIEENGCMYPGITEELSLSVEINASPKLLGEQLGSYKRWQTFNGRCCILRKIVQDNPAR